MMQPKKSKNSAPTCRSLSKQLMQLLVTGKKLLLLAVTIISRNPSKKKICWD
jgi:hypothetical protein